MVQVRKWLWIFLLALIPFCTGFISESSRDQVFIQWFVQRRFMKSPELQTLEKKVIDSMLFDCGSSRLENRLNCLIDTVRGLCSIEKKLDSAECLGWGDLFGSLALSWRLILSSQEYARLQGIKQEQQAGMMHELFVQHAVELGKIYSLAAAPCKSLRDPREQLDPQCEASRLGDFCLDYSRYRTIPARVCLYLLLFERTLH